MSLASESPVVALHPGEPLHTSHSIHGKREAPVRDNNGPDLMEDQAQHAVSTPESPISASSESQQHGQVSSSEIVKTPSSPEKGILPHNTDPGPPHREIEQHDTASEQTAASHVITGWRLKIIVFS